MSTSPKSIRLQFWIYKSTLSFLNMKKPTYYHLSSPENVASIAKDGLRANQSGEIFLFEGMVLQTREIEMLVSDSIAYNQVFLETYAVWEIKPEGIHGKIEPDAVGELTAQFQHVLHQARILPAFCQLIGTRTVDVKAVVSYTTAFYSAFI
jgi:hypothetical protein